MKHHLTLLGNQASQHESRTLGDRCTEAVNRLALVGRIDGYQSHRCFALAESDIVLQGILVARLAGEAYLGSGNAIASCKRNQ